MAPGTGCVHTRLAGVRNAEAAADDGVISKLPDVLRDSFPPGADVLRIHLEAIKARLEYNSLYLESGDVGKRLRQLDIKVKQMRIGSGKENNKKGGVISPRPAPWSGTHRARRRRKANSASAPVPRVWESTYCIKRINTLPAGVSNSLASSVLSLSRSAAL